MTTLDLFAREPERRGRLAEAVLARLRRGPATSADLNSICYRYGARIHELRRAGHDIRKRPLGAGLWEYRLGGES